jgi:hypothetical protein
MSRHPNQKLNYGRAFNPASKQPPPDPADLARIDRETAARDLEMLEKTMRSRPLKPPGRK